MLAARDAAKKIGIIDDSCTTGDFAHRVLIPATQSTGMSYAEFIASEHGKALQPAQCHVVHSWRMKLEDLLTGIAEFANGTGPNAEALSKDDLLSIPWHEAHRPENLEQRFFVCAFCVCHHSVSDLPIGNPKCEIDKFHLIAKRIHDAERRPIVVVLDAERLTLTRSCCIEEIHAAITGNIPICYTGPGCVTSTQKVDAMMAEAHEPLVQHMVFEKIRTMPGSFDTFNKILSEHVNAYAEHRLDKLRALLVRSGTAKSPTETKPEDAGSSTASGVVPSASLSIECVGDAQDAGSASPRSERSHAAASASEVPSCTESRETPSESRHSSTTLPTLLSSMRRTDSTQTACPVSKDNSPLAKDNADRDLKECSSGALWANFQAFCGSHCDLDGKSFAKLCKDTGLVDARFTATSADLVFAKVCRKGTRRLDFSDFQEALQLVAEKKSAELSEVLTKVASAKGPRLHKTTKVHAVRFHDDKSTYTGTHAHGGPDSGAKGIGSVGTGRCTCKDVNLGSSRAGDFY